MGGREEKEEREREREREREKERERETDAVDDCALGSRGQHMKFCSKLIYLCH